MQTIREILKKKSSGDIHRIGPDESVLQAVRVMAERNIGALLVMEGDRLIGILSERDYARKVILHGRRSAETSVGDIMIRDVLTVPPEITARQGLSLMTDRFIRHLPVLEGERVIGVVSIGDLVKAVIADQQALLEQLERYVTG